MFRFEKKEYDVWEGKMIDSNYVEHGDQKRTRKHIKGEATTYKMCMDICKRVGIAPEHVKTLNKYRHIYRYNTPVMDIFWELLYDHIANTHNKKDKTYEAIEQSGILKQMKQKIHLSHIEHLLTPYMKPKHEPLKFWEKKYEGLYITINCNDYLRKQFPDEFKTALDALEIKYFDIVAKHNTVQLQKIEDYCDIMNEGICDHEHPMYREAIDKCDELLHKWGWVLDE